MGRLLNLKGILFDLDGTLVSTDFRHREIILGKILGEFGKEPPSKEIINKFWFEGNRDLVIKENFSLDISDFWEVYHKYDRPELRKMYTAPFYDVEIISELNGGGYKLGIVTSAPPEIAEMEIGLVGKNLFDKIIVANSRNGFFPKPHPEGIIKCLHSLALNNYEAIFVGNSDEDMNAAKNAGVRGIHLDRKEYLYSNLNCDKVIYSLYELKESLK